jgi:hypothetical protein
VNRLGNLDGITHRVDVHVHHAWRFVKNMIMQCRLFDAAFLKFG